MKLPKGFRAAGISAGIKSSGLLDLALVINDGPNHFGTAVFTQNKIEAAPVTWSRQVVKGLTIRAVLLNSGGANACTGPEGFLDTHKSAEKVAEVMGISSSEVAICSTGMIGIRLPMKNILEGVVKASSALQENCLEDIARAIMTTDSKPKMSTAEIDGISFAGIAKGAGMLAPSLATMLALVMTDAVVDEVAAREIFDEVVNRTFNRIDSDGCTSTNDTVLFLASGASNKTISTEKLRQKLEKLCGDLAYQLIADAEGHSKIVSITTINAASEEDAVEVGRACARNNLLKCALAGQDPNWGRILAAVGTTSARFDPYLIDITLNNIKVCSASAPGDDRDLVDMSGLLIEIVIDLHAGDSQATIFTNDLTAEYVHENSAYAT